MPLIQLHSSVPIPEEKRPELLQALSTLIAESVGKPEQYVMASLHSAPILMSGQPGPAAFAEIRSIGGLGPAVNRRISQKLCQLLQQSLHIPPERVYLNFTEIPAADWGWRGDTFG